MTDNLDILVAVRWIVAWAFGVFGWKKRFRILGRASIIDESGEMVEARASATALANDSVCDEHDDGGHCTEKHRLELTILVGKDPITNVGLEIDDVSAETVDIRLELVSCTCQEIFGGLVGLWGDWRQRTFTAAEEWYVGVLNGVEHPAEGVLEVAEEVRSGIVGSVVHRHSHSNHLLRCIDILQRLTDHLLNRILVVQPMRLVVHGFCSRSGSTGCDRENGECQGAHLKILTFFK